MGEIWTVLAAYEILQECFLLNLTNFSHAQFSPTQAMLIILQSIRYVTAVTPKDNFTLKVEFQKTLFRFVTKDRAIPS